MGRLEMLVEKRNAILDEIARLNREIANKEEELEDVKYRISIQRILRERENILEEEINATGR